jgi:hypothetical protein
LLFVVWGLLSLGLRVYDAGGLKESLSDLGREAGGPNEKGGA